MNIGFDGRSEEIFERIADALERIAICLEEDSKK